MRRVATIAAAATCVAIATQVQSGDVARATGIARCPPPHTHVFRSTSRAVVFGDPPKEEIGFPIEGCAYGAGRAFLLGMADECIFGSTSFCETVEMVRLVGAMVAFEALFVSQVGEEVTSSVNLIVVRDLRTGRLFHRVPTGRRDAPRRDFAGVGPATSLVVRHDGSVAWIVRNEERSVRGTKYYEVHAIDTRSNRVLARGTSIALGSLSLRGDVLSWTQAGRRRSTTLR